MSEIKWKTYKELIDNIGKKPEPDLTEFDDHVDINTLSDHQDDAVYDMVELVGSIEDWIDSVLRAKDDRKLFINSLTIGFSKNKNVDIDEQVSKKFVQTAKKQIKEYHRINKYHEPVANI